MQRFLGAVIGVRRIRTGLLETPVEGPWLVVVMVRGAVGDTSGGGVNDANDGGAVGNTGGEG